MRTACPKCGTVFNINAQVVGRSVSCRKCGGVFVVQVMPEELDEADVLQEVGEASIAPPPLPPSGRSLPPQPAYAVEPTYDESDAPVRKPRLRTVQAGGLPGLSVVLILLYLVMVGVFFASIINFALGVVDFSDVNWGRMITLGILVLGVYPFLLLTLAVRLGVFISEKVLKVQLADSGWLASSAVGVSPFVIITLLLAAVRGGIFPPEFAQFLRFPLIAGAIYVLIHLTLGFPWSRGWVAYLITFPLWLMGFGAWVLAVGATKDAFESGPQSLALRSSGGSGVSGSNDARQQAQEMSRRIQESMQQANKLEADMQARMQQGRTQPPPQPTTPAGPPPQVAESIRQQQDAMRQQQEELIRRAQEAADRARANAGLPPINRTPGAGAGAVPPGMPPQAADAMRQAMANAQAAANAAATGQPLPGGVAVGDASFREPTKLSSYVTLSDLANLVPGAQVAAAGYGGSVAAAQQDKLGNTIVEIYPPTLTQRTASFKLSATPETRFAVSNDGQYVLAVTPGATPTADVWSASTGERIQHCDLGSDGGTPVPLGFTTNNTFTLLWSDHNDYWLQVVDIKTARGRGIKFTLPGLGVFGYTCTAANVAISPDGKMIAVVDGQYQLRLIDPVSGTVRRKMPVPFGDDRNAGVTAIAFSSDGKQIAILYDQDRINGASAICVGTVNVTGSKLVPLKFGKNLRQQAGDRFAGAFDKGELRKMDWMADNRTLLLYGQLMIETKNGTIVGRVCETPDSGFGPTMPDGQLQLGGDNYLLSYPKGVGPKAQHVYKLLAVDAQALNSGTSTGGGAGDPASAPAP